MDDKPRNELIEIIGGEYRTVYEQAPVYYQFLSKLSLSDQIEAWELILTMSRDEDTPKSGKRYNINALAADKVDEFKRSLSSLVDGQFLYLVASRPTPAEFAKGVWDFIQTLGTQDEQTFAIAWIMADSVIPYVQIPAGGVRMSDEEYGAAGTRLKPSLKMMDAILRQPKLQSTETASLILGLILDASSEEDRAVLLSIHMKGLQIKAMKKVLRD